MCLLTNYALLPQFIMASEWFWACSYTNRISMGEVPFTQICCEVSKEIFVTLENILHCTLGMVKGLFNGIFVAYFYIQKGRSFALSHAHLIIFSAKDNSPSDWEGARPAGLSLCPSSPELCSQRIRSRIALIFLEPSSGWFLFCFA